MGGGACRGLEVLCGPMTPPRILLLTHEHELSKATNTGRVVLQALGESARRVVWRRKEPQADLLRAIEAGGVALVWPFATGSPAVQAGEAQAFIVIDGTWQQARKIYNRSPYLHALPTVALEPDGPSIYTLRRNQIGGGLCTAEAVACLLRRPELTARGGPALAANITARLEAFLVRPGRSVNGSGATRSP